MALTLDPRHALRSQPPGGPTDKSAATGVAIIGTFPPRACGIATFTRDLRRALQGAWPGPIPVVALDRGASSDPTAYPSEVVFRIAAGQPIGLALPALLAGTGIGVVSLQHEFGLFGGTAGCEVLDVIDAVQRPVVTTLHTVPTHPDAAQERVLKGLIRGSERVIVMSDRGRRLLTQRYDIGPDAISVIPHGVPDVPFLGTGAARSALGLSGDLVILNYGLISPNKGLEMAIAALAETLRGVPSARLVIAGATHPEVLRRDGEAYRTSLQRLARDLGVDHRVTYVDRYLTDAEVQTWITAADIFVTPYGDTAQVTSGTLAYAVASGRAVVSTPYEHAIELLSDGRGRLVPPGDAHALANAFTELLTDPGGRERMRRAAWEHGRRMVWPAIGSAYANLFRDVLATSRRGVA